MKIYIDADGCPVVNIAVKLAKQFAIECIIICDTSHIIENEDAKTIMVSQGSDSVDFALVKLIQKGDIAITQDYGLAAMCLARGAVPISQDGMIYDDNNIDALLMQRHTSKKIRKAGGRFKGQAKRTQNQNTAFEDSLTKLLKKSV